MINQPVLILNQNYEPLNVCLARRALVLLLRGKAEVVENDSGYITTINNSFRIPSVIRLCYMIRRPYLRKKLTRIEIFYRDDYTCQYCGKKTHHLTLDHVIPKHRGGKHSWENVVSCCAHCNQRKAGFTPEEAGMKLIQTPRYPGHDGFRIPVHCLRENNGWRKFIPELS